MNDNSIKELTDSLYQLIRATTVERNNELDIILDPVKRNAVNLLQKHNSIEIVFQQGNRIIFKKNNGKNVNSISDAFNILEEYIKSEYTKSKRYHKNKESANHHYWKAFHMETALKTIKRNIKYANS